MPNRILRDGILASEGVCSLRWAEEVFYRRLMSVADDHGRFHSMPTLLRAACYPLQIDKVSDSDIGKWISACEEAGLVRVYPATDGKRYLQIIKFNQRVQAKSKFPDPFDSDVNGESPLVTVENRLGGGVVVGVFEDGGGGAGAVAPEPPPPDCPYGEIVSIYHAKLPMCPKVEKLTPARKGYIRARWREDLKTLEAFGNYFDDVAKSRFLTGRAAGTGDRPPFIADIDWLMRPSNFVKVAEGKYHRA